MAVAAERAHHAVRLFPVCFLCVSVCLLVFVAFHTRTKHAHEHFTHTGGRPGSRGAGSNSGSGLNTPVMKSRPIGRGTLKYTRLFTRVTHTQKSSAYTHMNKTQVHQHRDRWQHRRTDRVRSSCARSAALMKWRLCKSDFE